MLLQPLHGLNINATASMDPRGTMQLIKSKSGAVSIAPSVITGRLPSDQNACQLNRKFRSGLFSGNGMESTNGPWHRFGVTKRQARGARFRTRFKFSRKAFNLIDHGQEFHGQQQQPLAAEDPSFVITSSADGQSQSPDAPKKQYLSTVALPQIVPRSFRVAQLSTVDQALLLVGFIACTTSFALLAFVVTVIPTLHAMRKAANSVEKLADIAREELPGTMAAIRLSGMEISDLTLELNDLSQEISDGVRNSARAVHAAEVGLRQLGALAASQTFAVLQGTASVPVQVVRPAVVSAAATTLHAVSQAQKLVSNFASSSYPHISGWLAQRKLSGKQRKSVAKILSSASYSELLTREGASGSSSEKSVLTDISDKRKN